MSIDWNFVLNEEDEEEKKKKQNQGIDWDFVLSEEPPKEKPKTEKSKAQKTESLSDKIYNIQQAGKSKIKNQKVADLIFGKDPEEASTTIAQNYNEIFEKNPLIAGLMSGITGKKNIDQMNLEGVSDTLTNVQQEHPIKYGAGNISGNLLKTAGMYNLANPAATKIPGINKITNPFVRTQATMLGADTLVNAPLTIAEGRAEGRTKGEMLKDFAKREATDAAFNVVVGSAGELIKHLKKGKLAKINTGEEIKQLSDTAQQPITEGYKLSKNTPKVTKTSVPNKELLSVQEEWNKAAEKFNEFKKWLNNGAFGQPTTSTEFELFKEQTGIDIEDILKRMKEAENFKPKDLVKQMSERRRLGEIAGVYDPIKVNKSLIPDKLAGAQIKNSVQETATSLDGFKETKPIVPQEAKFLPKKDIKPIDKNFKDFYRNIKDVYGENYDIVNDGVIKPFNKAKKSNIDMQKKWTDETYDYIVKELGIKKGSKMSALVQRFGEGNISETELRKMLKSEDADKVVKADEFFRNAYNKLLETINDARATAYPDDPDMLIKSRKDYYRHFQDTSGSYAEKIKKVLNLGDDTPKMSVKQRKPKSSYFSIGKQRKGGKYAEDAVGGFLDYIKAASYATNIDPQIPKIRELANDIHKIEPNKYQNFVNYLHEFADDLSGRQNPLDKSIQNIIGRRAFTVLDKLNKRTKANAVMGNISSSLSQIANVPQGIATIKDPVALTKGVGDTLAGTIGQGKVNQLQQASTFLSERYVNDLYSRFDSKILDQPEKFASWMLGALDEVGTKFIWNSAFRKGITDNVADPIQYADEIARNMVAGRGIGELPLIQKSKVFQMLAPFQVEVANLWHVQKDMISEKDFVGLITLYIANNILNRGLESIRGSGATFDPIDAINDAIKEDDPTIGKVAGRLSGEVLSNIPLGQTAAALVPEEYRQQLFGKQDPTRFGTGVPITQAARNPLNILMPWGGGQMKKSIKGLTAAGSIPELNPLKENFGEFVDEPGVYSFSGDEKKMKYPVEDTPKNKLQTLLFGPGSTKQAREYYDKDMKILTPKQTKQVESGADYDTIQTIRKIESLKRKLDNMVKDPSISDDQKEKQASKIADQIEELVNKLGG